MDTEKMILGIDLNDDYAQISYYKEGMEEPASISAITGSKRFLIPVVVSKREGVGQWLYGEEAVKALTGMNCDKLLSRAVLNESIYIDKEEFKAEELLTLFLQKIISLGVRCGFKRRQDKVCIALESAGESERAMLYRIGENLNLVRDDLQIISYSDAFVHYCMEQEKGKNQRPAALFQLWKGRMIYRECQVNQGTVPKIAEAGQQEIPEFEEAITQKSSGTREEIAEEMDRCFEEIIGKLCNGKSIATVFLVGDGFEGEWMKSSLNKLLSGRRAFMGKNLYTKGACYAGCFWKKKDYLLLNEQVVTVNLSIKAKSNGEYRYITLLEAGKDWQDTKNQLEVILENEQEIKIYRTGLRGENLGSTEIVLEDFPVREEKMSRLNIQARALSKDRIKVQVTDMGFGQLAEKTERTWSTTLGFEGRK